MPWHQWENQGRPGENRSGAVLAMKDCLARNAVELDLCGYGLRGLPIILPPCQRLYCDINPAPLLPQFNTITTVPTIINRINTLPEYLPELFAPLNLNNARSPRLPAASSHGSISITLAGNQNMTVGNVNISGNSRLSLSTSGGGTITIGNSRINEPARGNISTPIQIASGGMNIDIRNNDLFINDQFTVNAFAERGDIDIATTAIRGQLDRRRAARQNHGVDVPSASRQLYKNIAYWLPPEQAREAEKSWGLINSKENTFAFNNFLHRLGHTTSALEAPALKLQVAKWIDKLSRAPSLRQLTFAIAEESSRTCEDRISLTYIEMQKAELIYDIDNGDFDDRLPELIASGRRMFRLVQLEYMAAAKAAALEKAYLSQGINPKHKVDVIGIYLAYQVKLNAALNLSSAIEKMRYFGTTDIIEYELSAAEVTIKQSENQDFTGWLAHWSPWQQVLRRVDAKGYETAITQRDHDLDNVYDIRVERELAALGLENDSDARAAIGKKVMDEINGTIHIKLTIDFLKNINLLALLDKPWQL